MQYAFSPEFLHSGDLRIFLAMAPPGSERNNLFSALMKKDALIQIKEGTPSVLSYSAEALKQQDAWHRLCSASGFLQDRFGNRLSLGGNYAGATCVLVGSGPSVNKEFVKEAADRGVVIITMGNACYVYPDAQLWIGAGDIIGYLPIPFERNATTAVVRKQYAEEMLWDAGARRQVGKKLKDTVGIAFFEPSSKSPTEVLTQPGVSDFGIPSTFTTALSLAMSLGFSNILLTGVDMGGSLDRYFGFNEIPHQDTVVRKTLAYTQIRMAFPEWNQVFLSRAIRVIGIGSSPFDIPVLSVDYLKEVLGTIMSLSRRLSKITDLRISTPAERKRATIRAMQRFAQVVLSPVAVIDKMSDLIQRVPEIFGAPEMLAVQQQMQEQLKKGGCSGCTKNRIGKPIYDRFVKEVVSGSGKLDTIWKELFPNHYVIRTGPGDKELRFRSDAVKEREEFETMQ